jgi:hypothetical protein
MPFKSEKQRKYLWAKKPAKQNLQDTWAKWKEQQRTTGIAFDPRSRAAQDVALTRALLDYLKAIGAKTIEDVKAAVKDLAGFSINADDAEYLLDVSRKENIAEKIKKGIDAQVPYADIESELLAEGYEKEDIAKRYNVEVGRETKSRDQQLREYQENFKKARRASRDKGKILDRVVDVATKFIKSTVDPKIEAKSLFKKLGMQSVLDRLQNIYGISGAAKFRFEEAYKKIYQGLSTEDTTILDQLIQLRRFIAIDENRAKNNLPKVEHPDFITGEDAKVRISDIQNQIGQAKFLDLQKRADAYFDEFRKTLDEFEKAGLISKELRDELYEIDYQPRKFLEFLLDADQRNQTAEQTRSEIGINKEVIKRLETGDDTELFNNSEWLLSTAINQAEIATKYNEFFRKLAKEIDKLKPEERRNDVMFNNPIIGLDKKGNPKYKFNKPPKGFTVVRYKDNGVENQIFMEQTVYDSLMGVDMFRDPGNTNTIKKILQAPGNFLRAAATGVNPAFVLGNLPNDFGFALTFEDAYSNILPKAIMQLSADMKNAWVSIANKDQTFKDFVKYGGMMDFLYTMGALDEKGSTDKVLDGAFSLFTDEKIGKERRQKISEGVTYLNKMSELGIRVGVYCC